MRIEAARQAVETLPITPRVVASLRETPQLDATHYSTSIEGNRLTQGQVAEVLVAGEHFPGSERDEAEVKGYYAALDELESIIGRRTTITQSVVKRLHALVVGGGKTKVKPSAYRDGQNVIRDSSSNEIVYLPPEARDVPSLMEALLVWIEGQAGLPAPLVAAIAYYQFATIHPYYDGNGRTARLLATLILHLGGYGLKGLFALEEYYARDLGSYYSALTVGPSHNCYLGRPEADITESVVYFIEGMAISFEKVKDQAQREALAGRLDRSRPLRDLDVRQRKVMVLFERSRDITAKEIADLFSFTPRAANLLCHRWVRQGFLIVSEAARKTRRYRLADVYEEIVARD
jgi:Fic family protein